MTISADAEKHLTFAFLLSFLFSFGFAVKKAYGTSRLSLVHLNMLRTLPRNAGSTVHRRESAVHPCGCEPDLGLRLAAKPRKRSKFKI